MPTTVGLKLPRFWWGEKGKREGAMIGPSVKDVAVHYVMSTIHLGTSHRFRNCMWQRAHQLGRNIRRSGLAKKTGDYISEILS
jgi:hypothetical protein